MPPCAPGAWKQHSCAGLAAARGGSDNGITSPLEGNTWRCPSLALRRPDCHWATGDDYVAAQKTARTEGGKCIASSGLPAGLPWLTTAQHLPTSPPWITGMRGSVGSSSSQHSPCMLLPVLAPGTCRVSSQAGEKGERGDGGSEKKGQPRALEDSGW